MDKYRWIDYGSSYLPSEMNAAYLYAQLEECEKINRKRHQIYDYYHEHLAPLEETGLIERPFVPEGLSITLICIILRLRTWKQEHN